MDFDDVEITLVINGIHVEGLGLKTAVGFLHDARESTNLSVFSTKSGRVYAFAGPLSVGITLDGGDRGDDFVRAIYAHLERLAAASDG